MTRFSIILAIGVTLAVAIGLVAGDQVKLQSQVMAFEGLRTTAAIIFAVMGAWIAIVFPDALVTILDKTRNDEDKQYKLVRQLLLPLILSTSVLIVLLVGAPLGVAIREMDLLELLKLRQISFCALILLTYVEVWALLLTLVPLVYAESRVYQASTKKARRRKVLRESQDSNQMHDGG